MNINLAKEEKIDWIYGHKIICVYKITNKINNKIYIGQTKNLRRRVSEYKTAERSNSSRSIIKAIRYYGGNNFELEVLEKTDDESNLNEIERKWIQKLDSTNPDKGYNENLGVHQEYSSMSAVNKSIAHIGLTESPDTKRKKSNKIIAISDSKVIICDSGKLFGDYIGKSKDYIKNCLRQPSMVNEFYIYYEDINKRLDMKYKMLSKRSIRNKTYMKYLYLLEECEFESVETIYSSLRRIIGKVYILRYENIKITDEHPEGELFIEEIQINE